jgi:hypothetical protein
VFIWLVACGPAIVGSDEAALFQDDLVQAVERLDPLRRTRRPTLSASISPFESNGVVRIG